jgi:predicted ATPase
VRGGVQMNTGEFSHSVQEYIRTSGYSQKELAEEVGLNAKVLSRKLNNSGNAHLTHLEIQRIITTLARWQAISTKEEVIHLLELAAMGPNYFSAEEWQRPPLNRLLAQSYQATGSNNSRSLMNFPKHNLPAPTTRLIGREWAVERLTQILERDEVRLLTLVGTGGSGKSRLALYVASTKVDDFSQGVWYVPLAGVNDPALVPMSIVQALNANLTHGVPIMQNLTSYLRNKHILLVLDNFEHVGEARTVVDDILAAVPGLKVLVTSRAVLHLYGEYEFKVPPLDVPDASIELKPEKLAQYGAIQLFVERAQAVMPDFTLTPENASCIALICARVDGLPLALELAAARVKLLSPTFLLKRLNETMLEVLTGGARNLPSRQQTLRNTIDWSYKLLSPVEQVWFPRLGIFVGGWSQEAAEAMLECMAADRNDDAIPGSVLEMLEQLADNSLLVRLPIAGEQVCFMTLDTLHEYMLEKLSEQGVYEQLRDWHANYYLGVVEEAEAGLRGPQQLLWLERLTANQDNIRSALEWTLLRAKDGAVINASFGEPGSIEETSDAVKTEIFSLNLAQGSKLTAIELSLRLAAALRPYWEWRGYLVEGRNWLAAALNISLEKEAGRAILAARAKALSEASRLVCLQNEQIRAVELAEESIALWRQLDEPSGLAMALLHRGWAAHAIGEYERAKRAYLEGIQQISPTYDAWLYAQLLFHLAAADGFTFDFEQMSIHYAQSRELFDQVGDKIAIADLLKDQGALTILEGNYNEAIDCLLRSIKMCYKLGHKQFVATGLGSLSFAVGLRGAPEPYLASIQSAQIGGAAESLMDSIGLIPWTKTNPLTQMARQLIRSRVEDDKWNEVWVEGRTLSIAQAIDLASGLV